MKNVNKPFSFFVLVLAFTFLACGPLPTEIRNIAETQINPPTESEASSVSTTDAPATEKPAPENTGPDLSSWNQSFLAALSPDGSLLAVYGYQVGGTIYDSASLKQIAKIPDDEDAIIDMAFSADNKILTLVYQPAPLTYSVKQLDFLNNVQMSDVEVHAETEYSDRPEVYLSPTGETLALFKAMASSLKLWDVPNARELRSVDIYTIPGNFSFSPDGKTLVFTQLDGFQTKLILVDVGSGNKRESPVDDLTQGGRQVVNRRTAFSPDGQLLAIASGYDYTLFEKYAVSITDYASGNELIAFDVPITPSMAGEPSFAMAFSKDGSLLVTGSATAITIWDIANGQALKSISYADENRSYGYDLLFVADDKRLISVSEQNNQVIMWDVATGQQIAP